MDVVRAFLSTISADVLVLQRAGLMCFPPFRFRLLRKRLASMVARRLGLVERHEG